MLFDPLLLALLGGPLFALTFTTGFAWVLLKSPTRRQTVINLVVIFLGVIAGLGLGFWLEASSGGPRLGTADLIPGMLFALPLGTLGAVVGILRNRQMRKLEEKFIN